jgi:hypothetical protein
MSEPADLCVYNAATTLLEELTLSCLERTESGRGRALHRF